MVGEHRKLYLKIELKMEPDNTKVDYELMLPLALSLPEPWRAAIVVIVFQSLVELFGMVAYLRWLPRLIRNAD